MSSLNILDASITVPKEAEKEKNDLDNDEDKDKDNERANKRLRKDELLVHVSTPQNVPLFVNHKYIGAFGTNEKLEMHYEVPTQYLSLPKRLQGLNISLDGGYESSLLIDHHLGENGYKIYRKAKFEHFLRWILENKYATKCSHRKKPIFIAFSQTISRLLTTPCVDIRDDWVVYAVRYNDFIVIERIESPAAEKADEHRRNWHALKGIPMNDKCFFHGEKFYQLFVTDSKESINHDSWHSMLDKGVDCYKSRNSHIFEVDFGSHSLLCLFELQAVDARDNSRVEFRVIKTTRNPRCATNFLANTSLKVWGNTVVPGVKKIVVGERSFDKKSNGLLEKIKLYTPHDLESLGKNWTPTKCYNFLDSLLTYIEDNLPVGNSSQVYQFTWKLGENLVTCEPFTGESFVPSWFFV